MNYCYWSESMMNNEFNKSGAMDLGRTCVTPFHRVNTITKLIRNVYVCGSANMMLKAKLFQFYVMLLHARYVSSKYLSDHSYQCALVNWMLQWNSCFVFCQQANYAAHSSTRRECAAPVGVQMRTQYSVLKWKTVFAKKQQKYAIEMIFVYGTSV